MTQWCKKYFALKGKEKVSVEKVMAYVGLEITMSFVQLNAICDLWQEKCCYSSMILKKLCLAMIFQLFMGV
jgi:hypothetical protein